MEYRLFLVPVVYDKSNLPLQWHAVPAAYDRRRAFVRKYERYMIDGKTLLRTLRFFPDAEIEDMERKNVPEDLPSDEYFDKLIVIHDRDMADAFNALVTDRFYRERV